MCILALCTQLGAQNAVKTFFPDGSPISSWFTKNQKVSLAQLGKAYVITDFGAKANSTLVQTVVMQKAIDAAAQEGGGVVVIPTGTYERGVIFKPKTHLCVAEGAVLKGSDIITDYPKLPSRTERGLK